MNEPLVHEIRAKSPVRAGPRVQTVNEQESMTVQSDRNRAEIRHIVAQYERSGVLLGLRDVDLTFRDVTEFEDFTDLMRQTKVAEARFMELPAKVREVFRNDVHEWLDAAHDAEKLDAVRPQLEKIGFLEAVEPPRAAPEPVPAPERSPA